MRCAAEDDTGTESRSYHLRTDQQADGASGRLAFVLEPRVAAGREDFFTETLFLFFR